MSDKVTMPYGKHKGKELKDIPSDYLLWVWDNNSPYGSVKTYIEDNLKEIKEGAAKLKDEYLASKA